MNTLLTAFGLGMLCLVLEIFNLRRFLVPVVLVGLAVLFGVNISDWNNHGPVLLQGIPMGHMLRVDHFSVAFSGLAIFITGLIIGMTADYYRDEKQHISDYLAILLFVLSGAIVLFMFANMVMLFLGIEIVSISLYILAGSRKYDVQSNEAGFKYFLMGSFATGILLFGIALMYGASHSFELSKVAAYAASSGMDSPMFKIGVLMSVVAMLFKVAAVPFHFWSPDVYEGSPTLVTAFMSTLVKVAMFAGFYQLLSAGLGGMHVYVSLILIIVAMLTMIIGNTVAIAQTNFKRLLAYSGISHAGYMLLALLSIPSHPAPALFFYGGVYALASIGAFAIAIPVFKQHQREDIDAFNGLARTNPFIAAMLTMCMLSLAGIPPMAGFLGKYYLFSEAIRNGYFAVTMVAILASAVGVYYYFKVILAMYIKSGDDRQVDFPMSYFVVAVVCVGLSLLFGVWPGWLMGLI